MDSDKLEKAELKPHQEDYIEVESQCCLCGTDLMFHYDFDPIIHEVKERAHCPSCGVQLKERDHTIH